MHSANLSILYSNKEKNCPDTGHLTSIVNVSCLRYFKQIEFQEELTKVVRT